MRMESFDEPVISKKEARIRKILGEGLDSEKAKDSIRACYDNFLDAKPMKAAKKELTRQLKAIDKAIVILAPTPKA